MNKLRQMLFTLIAIMTVVVALPIQQAAAAPLADSLTERPADFPINADAEGPNYNLIAPFAGVTDGKFYQIGEFAGQTGDSTLDITVVGRISSGATEFGYSNNGGPKQYVVTASDPLLTNISVNQTSTDAFTLWLHHTQLFLSTFSSIDALNDGPFTHDTAQIIAGKIITSGTVSLPYANLANDSIEVPVEAGDIVVWGENKFISNFLDLADRDYNDFVVIIRQTEVNKPINSISGTVYAANGTTPLPGVTVDLGGDATDSTTTDSEGNYTFSGLRNGSYTVTSTKTDFTFLAENPRTVEIAVDESATGVDFVAETEPAFTVSGTARAGGAVVELVDIALDASAATSTDSFGEYSIANVSIGNHAVTATIANGTATASFTNPFLVLDQDLTDLDFNVVCDENYQFTVDQNVPTAPLGQETAPLVVESAQLAGACLPIRQPITASATDNLFDQVTVTWNTILFADNYTIFRSQTDSDRGSQIGNSTDGTFSDTSAVPGVTYYYTIVAEYLSDAEFVVSNTDSGVRPIPSCEADNSVLNSESNSCVPCGEGQEEFNNACVPVCGVDEQRIEGSCTLVCGEGREEFNNACVPVCGVDEQRIEGSCTLVCGEGREEVNGACVDTCAVNENRVDGVCVLTETGCVEGQIKDKEGNCVAEQTLLSPLYAKYNTFLDQWNFLELISAGTKTIKLKLTLYSNAGEVIHTEDFTIEPKEQIDVDIHARVNQPDTYGLMKIEFNQGAQGVELLGRVTVYRKNANADDFSFAFTRELSNPVTGTTDATSNSFDPQGTGNLVPNWIEVANVDSKPRTFIHNLYNQDGALVESNQFTLPPMGQLDSSAGHEEGEGVYLNEIIPLSPDAPYLASVSRYSSNSPAGTVAQTYNFAFSIPARNGESRPQFVAANNDTGTCWSQTNWIEVVNTLAKEAAATIIFRDDQGVELDRDTITLAAHSQYHYNASAVLAGKATHGSVSVSSAQKKALLMQGLTYYHDCKDNALETAYVSNGRSSSRASQIGSLNTNLGMQNVISLIPLASKTVEDIAVKVNSGADATDSILSFGAFNVLGISTNTYGTVSIDTPAEGQVIAEVLRQRELADGTMDFVVPTEIK